MNHSKAVFLINDDVRAINCIYEPETPENTPKRTTFKTFDQTITEGDLVIVQTETRHGFTVCKVAETDVEIDHGDNHTINWIVGVLDTSEHEETVKAEKQAIQKIKSAQKRKEREALREALLADSEELKTLTIEAPSAQGN